MAKEKKPVYGLMARLNALVENGWLTVLTEAEVKLWVAFSKFADSSGLAWPDGATLSRHLGHAHERHIGTIRASLVRYGLMEIIDVGGGRGHPCKVKLLTPDKAPSATIRQTAKPPEIRGVSEVAKPPRDSGGLDAQTPRDSGINPPDLGNKPPEIREAYKEEQSNEPPKEQTNIHSARSASGVVAAVANVPAETVKAEDKKLSLQARVMRDVWEPKWSAAHFGAGYCPGRVDFLKLAEILKQLGSAADESRSISRFEKIADVALEQPEEFGWQGCKLSVVQKNLQWLISEVARKQNGASRANGHRSNSKPDRTIREGLGFR